MQFCILGQIPNFHWGKYLISNFLLGGLLEDMNYDAKNAFGDPTTEVSFCTANKLPKAARDLIIGIIEAVII